LQVNLIKVIKIIRLPIIYNELRKRYDLLSINCQLFDTVMLAGILPGSLPCVHVLHTIDLILLFNLPLQVLKLPK